MLPSRLITTLPSASTSSVGSQVAARCQQMVADCKARNCAGGGYSGCAVDCPGCSGGYDHITGWCALHPSYAGMASGGLSSFVGEIQACVTRFLADNQPGRRERGMECQGQAQKRLDDNWKRWIEQACQARCSQDGRRGAVKVMPSGARSARARASARSQPGSTWQSSSVKARNSPRARAAASR